MPRTLLDEVPPAVSVPVLDLLRISPPRAQAVSHRSLAWTGARCAVWTGRTYPRLFVNRFAEEVTHKLACDLGEPLVDCLLHEP